MVKPLIILVLIFWTSYILYANIIQKEKSSNNIINTKNWEKTNTTSTMESMVSVINPIQTNSWDIIQPTFLWEVLSQKNGSVYSYRDWIIKEILFDIWDSVKEWQVIAKMLPAQFNPELANMIVEKTTMKTKAKAMVASAELTLKAAQERKNQIIESNKIMIESSKSSLISAWEIKSRVAESTKKQLESTIVEQEAKIKKIQADLDLIDTQIKTQEQKILNMQDKTKAWVELEDSKLTIAEWNIKTSVKNAYNTLNRVFYNSNYNEFQNSQNFDGNIYFWAKNSNYVSQFTDLFTQGYRNYKIIDTLSQEEIFTLASNTLKTVDLWLKVLDNTILTDMYSESMLNDDKNMLIMAKTDDMNGIQTNLNMYNEQVSMLKKEQSMATADVTDEKLMLENMLWEKNVMQKELEMALWEKDKMIAEANNMKVMAENEAIKMESETSKMYNNDLASTQMALIEADKMITEAQKMLIDAKADLESANIWLNLLESAWFSNEIKAPFSGKLTKRYVNVWDAISMSSPAFDITQDAKQKDSNIFVRFEIPESEFKNISLWQEISFFRTIEPLKKYTATISKISPAINSVTKWIIIEGKIIENQKEDILVWSSVRVNLPNTQDVIFSIPSKVVKQDENGNTFIYKVLKNKVQKQIIHTSRTLWDNVIVSSWLKVGTKIIVDDGGIILKEWIPVKYMFVKNVSADNGSSNELVDEHASMWHWTHNWEEK